MILSNPEPYRKRVCHIINFGKGVCVVEGGGGGGVINLFC